MLTQNELIDLSRSLKNKMVLSVYWPREHADVGQPGLWKRRLEAALAAERRRVGAEAENELEAFDRARELIVSEATSSAEVLPSPGWVAFASRDELVISEDLPVGPVNMVRWRLGALFGPYLPVLALERIIAVGLIDRWSARLFLYENAVLRETGDLRADLESLDPAGTGMRKRPSSVTGVRGATRDDAASQALEGEEARFLLWVVKELLSMAGDSNDVVVGGAKEAARNVQSMIRDSLGDRVEDLQVPTVDLSSEKLGESAREAASRLTAGRQTRLLELCASAPAGAGVGWNSVQRALSAGAVEHLVLSEALLESSPGDVEQLVASTWERGGTVEIAEGSPGERLLREWDGVAARLRFDPDTR